MAKYEITKSIDVDEINKRSGLPTGKKRTLPFGAIIQDRVDDRDMERFTYRLIGDAPVASGGASPSSPPSPVTRPEYRLKWEAMHSSIPASRCKVPGGWMVSVTNGGLTFLPDAEHSWDGASV